MKTLTNNRDLRSYLTNAKAKAKQEKVEAKAKQETAKQAKAKQEKSKQEKAPGKEDWVVGIRRLDVGSKLQLRSFFTHASYENYRKWRDTEGAKATSGTAALRWMSHAEGPIQCKRGKGEAPRLTAYQQTVNAVVETGVPRSLLVWHEAGTGKTCGMVAAILAHLRRQTYEVEKDWKMPSRGWRRMDGAAVGKAGRVVVVQEAEDADPFPVASEKSRLRHHVLVVTQPALKAELRGTCRTWTRAGEISPCGDLLYPQVQDPLSAQLAVTLVSYTEFCNMVLGTAQSAKGLLDDLQKADAEPCTKHEGTLGYFLHSETKSKQQQKGCLNTQHPGLLILMDEAHNLVRFHSKQEADIEEAELKTTAEEPPAQEATTHPNHSTAGAEEAPDGEEGGSGGSSNTSTEMVKGGAKRKKKTHEAAKQESEEGKKRRWTYQVLRDRATCRFLLFTATPLSQHTYEIGRLLNLCAPRRERNFEDMLPIEKLADQALLTYMGLDEGTYKGSLQEYRARTYRLLDQIQDPRNHVSLSYYSRQGDLRFAKIKPSPPAPFYLEPVALSMSMYRAWQAQPTSLTATSLHTNSDRSHPPVTRAHQLVYTSNAEIEKDPVLSRVYAMFGIRMKQAVRGGTLVRPGVHRLLLDLPAVSEVIRAVAVAENPDAEVDSAIHDIAKKAMMTTLKDMAPKVAKFIENLRINPNQRHFVLTSNFPQYAMRAALAALQLEYLHTWKTKVTVLENQFMSEAEGKIAKFNAGFNPMVEGYKGFAQALKANPQRVLLATKAIREGISLFNVNHVHLLEVQPTPSATYQAIVAPFACARMMMQRGCRA